MELRISELEKRNSELEEQLHRSSDPLEFRQQQLTEEISLLQKKLQVPVTVSTWIIYVCLIKLYVSQNYNVLHYIL